MKKILLTSTALVVFSLAPTTAFAEDSWVQNLGKIFSGEDAISQGHMDAMDAEMEEMGGETDPDAGLDDDLGFDDEPAVTKRQPKLLDNGLEAPFQGFEYPDDIRFTSETTLDNGLTITGSIEGDRRLAEAIRDEDFEDESAPGGFEIGLGGHYAGYGFYTDQDIGGVDDFGIKRDGEIHFNPRLVADNGLTFGARMEIEMEEDGGGNSVDESYMYISGSFGQVQLGAEDGAAHMLHVTVPSADPLVDGIEPLFNPFNVAATFDARQTYGLRPTENADKITYFTPKLGYGGFQVGGSWAPDSIQDGIGSGLDGQRPDASTSAAGTLHDVNTPSL